MQKTALNILIIDDEARIRTTLRACLEGEGYRVATVATPDEALAATEREAFDMAFLDLRLETASGLDLLPRLLDAAPTMKVVVITAYASVETAVEAMKRGASDYLPKPFSPAQVRVAAERVAEFRSLETKVEILEDHLSGTRPEILLESQSRAMRKVLDLAREVSDSDATVLLTGESGTGKGVLARAIHAWSPRQEHPFVVVHCPSLSGELLESELFGHVRGAFTGATSTNPGRIAQAEGGTLFLDEIGELPLALQPKLLRFLQDREYERVGDPETRHANVRVLAASNQDLECAIEEGRFRDDLYYRLAVIQAALPPLRSRPEDVLPLARQFITFYAAKYHRPARRLTPEAQTLLRTYPWPGNVRELENAMERAVILAKREQIGTDLLALDASPAHDVPHVGAMVTLDELEEAHIRRILSATDTLEEAAETLGIDPATLWRRRKRYGL